MTDFPRHALHPLIDLALAEDIGQGDITSNSVIDKDAHLNVEIVAREQFVIAGLTAVGEVVLRLDPEAIIRPTMSDGEYCNGGDCLMTINGNARAILAAERTALNFLQHLSGIATLTRDYVRAILGTGAVMLDTRKTLPGYRELAKYAVQMGGGANHRMGLYDALLIKDNHIAAAGGIEAAIEAARAQSKLAVEIECDTLEQVGDAIAAGAERLLLDNMSLEELRRAVQMAQGQPLLEASGGVTLDTVRDIALTGVDFISVGRITQSAPAVDIGMDYIK